PDNGLACRQVFSQKRPAIRHEDVRTPEQVEIPPPFIYRRILPMFPAGNIHLILVSGHYLAAPNRILEVGMWLVNPVRARSQLAPDPLHFRPRPSKRSHSQSSGAKRMVWSKDYPLARDVFMVLPDIDASPVHRLSKIDVQLRISDNFDLVEG